MYEVKQATALCILLVTAGVQGYSDLHEVHLDDRLSLVQLKLDVKKRLPALQSAAELASFAPDLKDYGVKLFGSEAQLDKFLQNTDPPAILSFDGVNMYMKQSKGDNSIKRLGWEAGDSYGLDRIAQPFLRAQQQPKGVLLDIGTNIGAVSIAVAKKFPAFQVLTVEPIPSTHFLACLNLRLNQVKTLPETSFGVDPEASGVLALQRAVASENKVVPMEYSLISSQDSVVKGQRPTWEKEVNDTLGRPDIGGTWQKVDVQTLVIPEYLAAHQIHHVNFMKMDCEGCEFDAVPHMGPLLSDCLQTELFAGEIHRSKVAGASYFGNTTAFNDVLAARGCPQPLQLDSMVVC
jgi:FkbM family methyltransferase